MILHSIKVQDMWKSPSRYIINLFHTAHLHLRGESLKILRNVIFVSVCFVMTLLTGCGDPSHSYYSLEDSEYDTADFLEFKTEYSEYERDVKEITYSITNNGDEIFWYGYMFELHRFDDDDGEWKGVAFDKEYFFFLPAIGIKPSKTGTDTIDLEEMYNLPLSPGRYRFEKDGGNDGGEYVMYAEFTIK